VGKLDRIVKKAVEEWVSKEATINLYGVAKKSAKAVAKAIFEDIEKRMGELDPVMEIWAITEKDWQDLKRRFGVEDES